jgi:hypothetical protein
MTTVQDVSTELTLSELCAFPYEHGGTVVVHGEGSVDEAEIPLGAFSSLISKIPFQGASIDMLLSSRIGKHRVWAEVMFFEFLVPYGIIRETRAYSGVYIVTEPAKSARYDVVLEGLE